MTTPKLESTYTATYTSFSGADIVATFGNHIIGELQAISYSVTREKVPIYTMGSPDPRSFSRGKRGIAGSLVFTVFNKDALFELKDGANFHTSVANSTFRDGLEQYIEDKNAGEELKGGYFGDVETWEELQNDNAIVRRPAYYADEIPPFDITITMLNEYGQAAKFSLIGVEILNEGSGMSIDDITTEKACTFVARGLTPLKSVNGSITVKDITNKNQ
jgi:hypothetical protein